ncbi:MAG: response regulator [Anaerolineae bacterium]|nr:response regulator [Anaerolineae bacterium]MDK1118721.1 response regulator [Anaerolineae bacterium]
MKKVWIVDDDQEMTDALCLMLELLECEASSYLNARSVARTLLEGDKPDYLFLDINMPEVSGLDLLEFIRRRSEWKDLPIIMLSTEAADVTVDRAMQLGADSYIMKPVTIEEIENSMQEAYAKHQKGV